MEEIVWINVKYYCEYNGLIVYKSKDNLYYCHYWNEKKLYTANKYDGWKFEASCRLKPDRCLRLISPMFVIKRNGIIQECFKSKKEAEEKLLDYDVYEWFDEYYIREINHIINPDLNNLVTK